MNDHLNDQVDRLLEIHVEHPAVLSVYAALPRDLTEGLRGLGARVHSLLVDVHAQVKRERDHRRRRRLAADLDAVHAALATASREWLGHSVAIFAAGELGLFLELRLPCALPNRAVLGTRPHVRPLLAAGRRCRPYCAVVVDRRHAWVYLSEGSDVRLVRRLDAEGQRAPAFAGWYGLEEYGVRRRAGQLVRHHYLATVDALREVFAADYERLVVGGHAEGVAEFQSLLPADLRARLAGTFVVDPHTMTSAQVREHAAVVVADWERGRQRQLVADMTARTGGARVVTGLEPCLVAATEHAVEVLLLDAETGSRGSDCPVCGALGVDTGPCRACGAATRPVPDVVDELVARVSQDGGLVETTDLVTEPIARLRYELPTHGA